MNKDHGKVGNYRPIFLITNDLKIMTKILANRMTSFIDLYVRKDQVEFIPGQQGPDRIKSAIDIISLLQSNWAGRTIEKHCSFRLISKKHLIPSHGLINILHHWGFGHRFMRVMKVLIPRSTSTSSGILLGTYQNS